MKHKLPHARSPDFLVRPSRKALDMLVRGAEGSKEKEHSGSSGYFKTKEKMQWIAGRVKQLQDRMVETSQRLQLEYQMERFVEQEIAEVRGKVEAQRDVKQAFLRKPKNLSKDYEILMNRRKNIDHALNDVLEKTSAARVHIKDLR